MATLYCDLENGNDNYGGSSFALLASGVDGTIVTATFTSITASFPDDGSLIGQYLSIFNGSIYVVYNITAWVSATSLTIAAISGGTALADQTARQYYIGGRWKNITTGATAVRTIPGDTIRIMGSPAPTSLGQNGVWTSQALQATKSVSGSTNATPISVTSNSHGYSTGDTVVITGHTTNTNANGTWEITSTGANTFTLDGSVGNGVGGASGSVRLRNNTRVMLTTAVTQNIASTGPGRAAWTASANVTTGLGTTKEHANSDSIAIAADFTTGLAAYWATPSTLDLSSYQQVSFWVRQSSGNLGAAGSVDIRLCSDAAGVTAVHTINIPALGATNRWMPVTVDLGTNLDSSIQSIALYVNTDNGSQTFLLNNIIACKASSAADSLTLTSLIGKNTTGETFWGIQSINGTRVMLDADTHAAPQFGTVGGYYGTSETVTTWKRETIKLGPAAANTTALQTIQEGGTNGSPITFSGGWDRTDMSTQNLETWLDGQNGNGLLFNSNRTHTIKENFAAVRMHTLGRESQLSTSSYIAANNCADSSGSELVRPVGLSTLTIDHIVANNCTREIKYNSGVLGYVYLRYLLLSTGARAVELDGRMVLAGLLPSTEIRSADGTGAQFRIGQNAGAYSGFIIKNLAINYSISNTLSGDFTFSNCLFSNSTEIGALEAGAVIYSHNHDQIIGNHKIFHPAVFTGTSGLGALISSATDQRHTASGISWKIQPSSTNRSSAWPVPLSLAKVACAANSLVTVKAWMRRTNTGLTMRLVCKGDQIAGVATDVTASMSAVANTWEELTITFTPTEVGVVEITAEAFGGTTFSGWVDDLTISQA